MSTWPPHSPPLPSPAPPHPLPPRHRLVHTFWRIPSGTGLPEDETRHVCEDGEVVVVRADADGSEDPDSAFRTTELFEEAAGGFGGAVGHARAPGTGPTDDQQACRVPLA